MDCKKEKEDDVIICENKIVEKIKTGNLDGNEESKKVNLNGNEELKKVNLDGNEELKKVNQNENEEPKKEDQGGEKIEEEEPKLNGYATEEEKVEYDSETKELDFSIENFTKELFEASSNNPIEIELNVAHDKEGKEFCDVSPSGLNVVDSNFENDDKSLCKAGPSNLKEIENETSNTPVKARLKRTKLSLNIIPHGKKYIIKKSDASDANNVDQAELEGKINEGYVSRQVSIIKSSEEYASDGIRSKEIITELSNHQVNNCSKKHETGGSKQDIELDEIADGFVVVELDGKQDGVPNSDIGQKKPKVELVGWDKFRSIVLVLIIILLIIWIILIVYFSSNYDI